jgi:hypothetical protein
VFVANPTGPFYQENDDQMPLSVSQDLKAAIHVITDFTDDLIDEKIERGEHVEPLNAREARRKLFDHARSLSLKYSDFLSMEKEALQALIAPFMPTDAIDRIYQKFAEAKSRDDDMMGDWLKLNCDNDAAFHAMHHLHCPYL